MRVSIRYQILIAIMAVVGVSAASYLYLVTAHFEKHHIASAYDHMSATTHTKSQELVATLNTLRDKLLFIDRLLEQSRGAPNLVQTAKGIWLAEADLLTLDILEEQPSGTAIQWRKNPRDAGLALSRQELITTLQEQAPALSHILAEGFLLANVSLAPDVPLLRVAFANADRSRAVVAILYPNRLLRLISESDLATTYAVNATGHLVLHPDRNKVIRRENVAAMPGVQAALKRQTSRGAGEFQGETGPVLSAFSEVGLGRLVVVSEIGRGKALAAVSELNQKSMWFGLTLLFAGLLVSIGIARHLTKPIATLEAATVNLSRGHFDVSVDVKNHNEIGQLASAFNQMSRELKARDQKLKETYTKMLEQDRLAKVGTLAAGVGHEINNPLAYILVNHGFVGEGLSAARSLLDKLDLSGSEHEAEFHNVKAMLDNAEQANQDIGNGADRVQNVARDLKLFARAQDDDLGPVDLKQVLESSLKMAWHKIRHRAQIVKIYHENTPPVMANESRLGQVVLNLLVNAAQAMPTGAVEDNTITVGLALAQPGRVMVTVSDTGSGIEPEKIEKVFDPFYTSKPVGMGTGLGLAICKRIIGESGGHIEVESEVGKGTTFRVYLPAVAKQPRPKVLPPQEASGSVVRARVLVVDDEPEMGDAFRRSLAAEHDITSVTSGAEALELLNANSSFDVVFCDLVMPTMTGMELFAQVQREKPHLAPHFVFISAGAFLEDVRTFLDTVPNRCLEKPFDMHEIKAAIRETVTQAARVAHLRSAAS